MGLILQALLNIKQAKLRPGRRDQDIAKTFLASNSSGP